MPLVSVIIPCYNHAEYLHEAIESVYRQTCKDFEVIIVNDGSNDNTAEIAVEWTQKDHRIKYFEQANLGLSAARNNGITASKGELILPLDADNKLNENYIEKVLKVFTQDTEIDIVYTDAVYFGEKQGIWKQADLHLPTFLVQNIFDACAMFRKEVWKKAGGYQENMKYGWEDWDLWLKAYKNDAHIFHLKEPLFYYRVSKSSMVGEIGLNQDKRQYLEHMIIANNKDLYKQYFPEPLSLLRDYYGLQKEKEHYERYKQEIYNSRSYKLGKLILSPLRAFKSRRKKS